MYWIQCQLMYIFSMCYKYFPHILNVRLVLVGHTALFMVLCFVCQRLCGAVRNICDHYHTRYDCILQILSTRGDSMEYLARGRGNSDGRSHRGECHVSRWQTVQSCDDHHRICHCVWTREEVVETRFAILWWKSRTRSFHGIKFYWCY